MLEGGYTSVCEFHYLHNDVDGRPYADDATLASCLARRRPCRPRLHAAAGALSAGRLWRRAAPPRPAPLRPLHRHAAAPGGDAAPRGHGRRGRWGWPCIRSARSRPRRLQRVLTDLDGQDASAPIHIHVAEQRREVEECLAWSGQRAGGVAARSRAGGPALVPRARHAYEVRRNAAGLGHRSHRRSVPHDRSQSRRRQLRLAGVDRRRGRADGAVGSDSHVTVNAAEELRLLEYSQRVRTGRRNVAATAREGHVATAMTLAAVAGGAAAAGRPVAGLAPGQRADFVVLDGAHPLIAGLTPPEALDAHVFASHRGVGHRGRRRRRSVCGARWPSRPPRRGGRGVRASPRRPARPVVAGHSSDRLARPGAPEVVRGMGPPGFEPGTDRL